MFFISKNEDGDNKFDPAQIEMITGLIDKTFQSTENAEMASAMEELLGALEQISATAKNPNLPSVLEGLEESSLVKGIDCFVLAIATRYKHQEVDKYLKLR